MKKENIFLLDTIEISYLCIRISKDIISIWRGARVVMEQIANLSTGNRRQGSNPCLSAKCTGCSVARLSRLVWDEEVAGSNPATPTKTELLFGFLV